MTLARLGIGRNRIGPLGIGICVCLNYYRELFEVKRQLRLDEAQFVGQLAKLALVESEEPEILANKPCVLVNDE
jgi:hypothetical protein